MHLGHDGGTPLSVRLGSRFTSRPIDLGVCFAIVHLLLNDECIILAPTASNSTTEKQRRSALSSCCTTFSNTNACKPKKARSEIHSICGRQAANSPIRMDLLGWSIRNASASGREEAEPGLNGIPSSLLFVRQQIGGDYQNCNRVNHQSPKLATWRKSFSASRSCFARRRLLTFPPVR